jgi:hypothetical protein
LLLVILFWVLNILVELFMLSVESLPIWVEWWFWLNTHDFCRMMMIFVEWW